MPAKEQASKAKCDILAVKLICLPAPTGWRKKACAPGRLNCPIVLWWRHLNRDQGETAMEWIVLIGAAVLTAWFLNSRARSGKATPRLRHVAEAAAPARSPAKADRKAKELSRSLRPRSGKRKPGA
jgi:hypothetical protein